MKKIIGAIAVGSIAFAAGAQDITSERTLTLKLANDLVTAAVASCTASGYNVVATVVDRSGYVKAMQRADNARPHAPRA